MQEANCRNQPDAVTAAGRGIDKPPIKDRRCSPRLALRLPVEACAQGRLSPQTYRGTTRDISAKGVYFVCGEAYLAGQLVYVTIRMSGDLAAGSDSVSLTSRYRVKRVEEIFQNGSKRFGIAAALEA
jgi:hypothetical protein